MTRLVLFAISVLISGAASAVEPTSALDALAARTVFEYPTSSQPTEVGERSSLQLAGTWQQATSDANDTLPKLNTLTWAGVMIPNLTPLSAEQGTCQLLRVRFRIPDWLKNQSFHLKTPYATGVDSIWCNGRKLAIDANNPWLIDVSTELAANKAHEFVIVGKAGAELSMPEPPTLVATAAVYATELFTKSDIQAQRLTLEITLRNATDKALIVAVEANIYSMNRDGQVFEREPAMKLPREIITLPAHGQLTRTLTPSSTQIRPWWPDEPKQYHLRVLTQTEGRTDRIDHTFAHRQWNVREGRLHLNEVPYRLRSLPRSLNHEPNTDALQRLRQWQAMGQNLLLYEGMTPWVGNSVESTLQFLTQEGMPTARIVGNRGADSWPEMLNIIRHERTNCSIAMWVLDLPGSAADVEKVVEQVRAIDPTRPIVVRGQAVPDTLRWVSVTTLKQWQLLQASSTDKPALLDLSTLPTVDREQLAIDARRLGCSITHLGKEFTDNALSPIWQLVVALEQQTNNTGDLNPKLTQEVTIFNDSRASQTIELYWLFQTRDTQPIRQVRGQTNVKLAPCEAKSIDVSIDLAGLERLERLPCDFVLSCKTDHGQRSTRRATIELFTSLRKLSGSVELWDPHNRLRNLETLVNVRRLDSLANIPTGNDVLVVAPDAIEKTDDGTKNRLLNSGRRLVVFQQAHPLEVPAISLRVQDEPQSVGPLQPRIPESVLWSGLRSVDFTQWPILEKTLQYHPPEEGTPRYLSDGNATPLVAVPSPDGVTLLCQLPLGESATHPVVRRLVRNLILLAREFEPANLSIVTSLPEFHPWPTLLKQERFDVTSVADIGTALLQKSIILLQADAATLTQLAELKPNIETFIKDGGWIVLTELAPDGLSSFNALVEESHLIRNVANQSMMWNRPQDEAQLRLSDSALSVARSPYKYVVTTDNLAPFLKGVESAIRHNIRRGTPSWKGEWDRPQTIDTISFRHPPGTRRILTMRLFLDGKPSRTLRLGSTGELQTFSIDKQTCRRVELHPISWTDGPGDILGLDDLRIPPAKAIAATPWDLAGGILAYPRGNGGILLLQQQLDPNGRQTSESEQQRRVVHAIFDQIGAKPAEAPPAN